MTAYLVMVDSVPAHIFLARRRAEAFAQAIGSGAAILVIAFNGEP